MFSAKRLSLKRGRVFSTLALSSLLVGCVVHSPATIQQREGSAANVNVRTITLLESEGDQGLRTNFRNHLHRAFAEHAVSQDDAAEIIGDFAISSMPSEMALISSSADAGKAVTEAKSSARRAYLLDNCPAKRFRASLILFQRGSGEPIYRAESEAQGCINDPVPLAELADKLVDDALLAQE